MSQTLPITHGKFSYFGHTFDVCRSIWAFFTVLPTSIRLGRGRGAFQVFLECWASSCWPCGPCLLKNILFLYFRTPVIYQLLQQIKKRKRQKNLGIKSLKSQFHKTSYNLQQQKIFWNSYLSHRIMDSFQGKSYVFSCEATF